MFVCSGEVNPGQYACLVTRQVIKYDTGVTTFKLLPQMT